MWRSDVTSLWKSAANTIASVSETVQENVSYYVDVENVKSTVVSTASAIGGAVIGTAGALSADDGFDEKAEAEADLDAYKRLLEETQMQHVLLSKELGAVLAVKDKEILAYKEKYGLMAEEDVQNEKVDAAALLLEKKTMEINYQLLESKYQSHLSKVNEADASVLKLRMVQDKYTKLVHDFQLSRESFESKDRDKQDTIEGLISEYSQLSADTEKKTKQLKDVSLENERLEIKLQALENNICEFADRAANSGGDNSSSGGGLASTSPVSSMELKDLRSKVLNLQFDLREKDLSISSLKDQLEQASSKRPPLPPSASSNDSSSSSSNSNSNDNTSFVEIISKLEKELVVERETRLSKENSLEKLQEKILGLKADIEKISIEKKEAEGLAKDLHDKNKKFGLEVDGLKKMVDSTSLDNQEKGKLNASQSAKIVNLEAQLSAAKTLLDDGNKSTESMQSQLEADLMKSRAECARLKLENLESSETLQRVKDQLKKEIDSLKDQLKKEVEKFQLKLDQEAQLKSTSIESANLTLSQRISEIEDLNKQISISKSEFEKQSKVVSDLKLSNGSLESALESLKASEKSLQERNNQLANSSTTSQSENQKYIDDLQAQHIAASKTLQKEIDRLKQEMELFQLKCQKELSQLKEENEREMQQGIANVRDQERKEKDEIVAAMKDGFEVERKAADKLSSQLKEENERKMQLEIANVRDQERKEKDEIVAAMKDGFEVERKAADKASVEMKERYEIQIGSLRKEIADAATKVLDLSNYFDVEKSRINSEGEREKSRLITEKDELLKKSLLDLSLKFEEEKQEISDKNEVSLKSTIAHELERHKMELDACLRSCNAGHEANLKAALESLRIEEMNKLELELGKLTDAFTMNIGGLKLEHKQKSDEYDALIANLRSDLQTVESRFEIKIKEACAKIESQKKAEFDAALAITKAECKQQIDAARVEKEEYFQLYSKECKQRKLLHNKIMEFQGNIRVFCRVRPILEVERRSGEDANVATFPGNEELVIQKDPQTKSRFEYDKTFPPGTAQDIVFDSVQPLCVSALDGFNVCIFAYGQTGSGKTYTMDGVGAAVAGGGAVSAGGDTSNIGVSPRCFLELFKVVSERQHEWAYTLTFSMLEIYNESILDLLNDKSAKEKEKESNKLDVRQGPDGNIVPGLTEIPVVDFEHIRLLLAQGQRNRAVGSHDMNEHSSRSHSIITVTIKGKSKLENTSVTGKLHLIDLAGSERVGKTDASGDRLKEAQNINRSLSALGDVIHALGEKSSAGKKGGAAAGNAVHIPYRNSKLTFLLQDSLGGNSKVLMFVNISPASYNVGESLCSLQFASRCRAVELGQAKKQIENNKK